MSRLAALRVERISFDQASHGQRPLGRTPMDVRGELLLARSSGRLFPLARPIGGSPQRALKMWIEGDARRFRSPIDRRAPAARRLISSGVKSSPRVSNTRAWPTTVPHAGRFRPVEHPTLRAGPPRITCGRSSLRWRS